MIGTLSIMHSRLRSALTASGLVVAALLSMATSKPKKDDPTANAPIDSATEPYIGDWESDDTVLQIGRDRSVHYKKKTGSTTKSVDGTLKGIENGNIVVKAAFLEVKFKIDAEPEEEEGIWEMTIDGEELTKKGSGAGKTASLKEKLEGSVVTQFANKGVTKCVCPNPASRTKFTCTATLKNGKTAPVEMTKNPATHNYSFTIKVAAVESSKLEADLSDMVFKETKGKIKPTVSCGGGTVYIPDGDGVTCDATDPKTKKKGTIDADLNGGTLHWKLKGL